MLSANEQLRFSRQTMLKGIGEQGQQALKNASVLIIGVGGLGNPVSVYLKALVIFIWLMVTVLTLVTYTDKYCLMKTTLAKIKPTMPPKNYSNLIAVITLKCSMKCSTLS